MFAYCGNNPVLFSDPSGNIRVCATEREIFYVPITEQITVSEPEDQVYGIVNGQEYLPYADEKIGLGSYKKSGCAYIAAYNALQLTGNGKPLSTVTYEIYNYYGSLMFGAGGVAPRDLSAYLSDQVQGTIASDDLNSLLVDIPNGSVITFTIMNNKSNIFKGWHAMTALYEDGKYSVFNRYSNRTQTYEMDDLEEAVGEGRFLYGIRIDP